MKDKTFIKAIKRPSGRVVEVEYNDGGPQSVQTNSESEATQPRRGGLRTWVTTDGINGSFVHFRSRGVFASLMDDQNLLAFISRVIGAVGNLYSIEYIAPDQDEPLLVTVEGNKITIKMHTTGGAVAASLDTSLSGLNNDLKFTAKETGVDGNDISVEYVAPTDEDVNETVASTDGSAIIVELEGTGRVDASLTTASGSNKDVKFVAAGTRIGSSGNTLTVAIQHDGGYGPALDHPSANEIWFRGMTGKTAQDLVDYAATNPISGVPLHNLLTVELAPANNGTGIPDAFGLTALSGGQDSDVIAIADDVKDAIESDEASDALVSVENSSGNDGSGIVTDYDQTNLSGGADAATIINTASEVKEAIEANPNSAKLVSVLLQNDSTMFEMSETNLTGGDDDVIMEGSVELS